MRKGRELAVTYANAIYEVILEGCLTSLKAVDDALKHDHPLRASLKDQAVELAQKQDMVRELLPDGAGQEVFNFLSLLLSKNHLDVLGDVILQLERLARGGPGARVARVTSAIALTDEEREQIEEKLAARFGSGLDFEFVVDESILGGLTVRVGDEIIDGSVAGKLGALKESLVSTQ